MWQRPIKAWNMKEIYATTIWCYRHFEQIEVKLHSLDHKISPFIVTFVLKFNEFLYFLAQLFLGLWMQKSNIQSVRTCQCMEQKPSPVRVFALSGFSYITYIHMHTLFILEDLKVVSCQARAVYSSHLIWVFGLKMRDDHWGKPSS